MEVTEDKKKRIKGMTRELLDKDTGTSTGSPLTGTGDWTGSPVKGQEASGYLK